MAADRELAASLSTAPDGPYLLRGPIRVTDAAGNEMVIPHGRSAALCRCGNSEIKPFCDGAHKQADFSAAAPAPDQLRSRFTSPTDAAAPHA